LSNTTNINTTESLVTNATKVTITPTTSPFLTTKPITLSSPTKNTTNDPLEQLRTEVDQNIRDGKQNIVKLAAAVVALEKSSSQLRNQLKANTTELQMFLKSIEDYGQKLSNNWEMKLFLETAKSEVQTIIKSFDLINDRLNQFLRND
jgi:septal ring factor EnvC (AmiA/AmiB activator)